MNDSELKQLLSWKRTAWVFILLFVLIVAGLFVYASVVKDPLDPVQGPTAEQIAEMQQTIDGLEAEIAAMKAELATATPDEVIDEANQLLDGLKCL